MTIARRIGILLAALALVVLPLVLAGIAHPTPIDWRTMRFDGDTARIEALAGRAEEIRDRDAAWNQGRTEMEFLAQYEQLRTQGQADGQRYRQGRNIGQQMGRDAVRSRYGS